MAQLQELFEKCMEEYIEGKSGGRNKNNPLFVDISENIPLALKQTGLIDLDKYKVEGKTGSGAWTHIPNIAIMNKKITTSTTKGVYIVYLFSKNGDSLYLTLNQGCTEIKKQIQNEGKQKGKTQVKRVKERLRQRAQKIQDQIDNKDFATDDHVYLGEKLSDTTKYYPAGTIFYKKYEKGHVPPDDELLVDLKTILEIYDEYAKEDPIKDEPAIASISAEMTKKEIINEIKKYIESKGFTYPDGMIENFYLSLKSKPFVILAGVSGTGKTRLARLFAEAVGANNENNRYLQVPVRPDWSDSSDLFGYKSLNNEFVHGAIIDFIVSAESDKENPYFLCLDEMNLARVEYYLSDILSLIETRSFDGDEIKTDSITNPAHPNEEDFKHISLPDNLYIIGTVNMDETTFPFSKKVLDRANTIEFSDVDLTKQINFDTTKISTQNLGNDFFKAKYLLLKDCMNEDEEDFVVKNCQNLQEINEILKEANAQFGYRVRDEIIFYLLNNKNDDLISNEDAFDNAIMQKILPRIQGSSQSIRSILCELFALCVGSKDSDQTDENNIDKKIDKVLKDSSGCLYANSAEKIAFMIRRYDEDGFTSYWF